MNPAPRNFVIISVAVLVASAGLLNAGPLNPPVGPVTSTMKTLTEVEPRIAINATNTPGDADSMFKITSPGSYYLTANVLVAPGKRGIEIDSDDVSIDLNGLRIAGFAGALEGVKVVGSTNRQNVAVTNGVVRGVQDGLDLLPDGLDTRACRVENVSISDCPGLGLRAGTLASVQGVTARLCTAQGIWVGSGSVVARCKASQCETGFQAGTRCTIIDCTSDSNSSIGYDLGSRCFVRSSIASASVQEGFVSEDDTRFIECSAIANGVNGFVGGQRTSIVRCTASAHVNAGMFIGTGTVEDCVISSNTGWGVRVVGGYSTIQRNALDNSGQGAFPAISIVGRGSRVEGNTITQANLAVSAEGANNLIVGNTFDDCNTAIQSAAGNRVGPIVVGTFSPAINGNTGGGLGTADPYANIIY